MLSYPHETWWKWLTHEVTILTKFHKNKPTNVNFLLLSHFWMCLIPQTIFTSKTLIDFLGIDMVKSSEHQIISKKKDLLFKISLASQKRNQNHLWTSKWNKKLQQWNHSLGCLFKTKKNQKWNLECNRGKNLLLLFTTQRYHPIGKMKT